MRTPREHVSETAFGTAMQRALESGRPDALFVDPLARRLAGDEGAERLRRNPRLRAMDWYFAARTRMIDDLLAGEAARGADRVLVLGAGLDARPWRLALPPGLRWIEADFPDLLAEKRRRLGDARPACAVESAGVDLADREARRALLARAAGGARRAVALAEGLLVHLDAAVAADLAADLRRAGFAAWIADLATPAAASLARWRSRRARGASTGFRFGPASAERFFAAHGWRMRERRPVPHFAADAGRLPARLRLLFRLFGRDSRWLRFLPLTFVCAAEPARAA